MSRHNKTMLPSNQSNLATNARQFVFAMDRSWSPEAKLLPAYKCFLLHLEYMATSVSAVNSVMLRDSKKNNKDLVHMMFGGSDLFAAAEELTEAIVMFQNTLSAYKQYHGRSALRLHDLRTMRQSVQLIRTVKALGQVQGHRWDNNYAEFNFRLWSTDLVPILERDLNKEQIRLVDEPVEPVGSQEASNLMAQAMQRLRARWDDTGEYTVLSSLLMQDRVGSYPHHGFHTTDSKIWLRCGWNLTKTTHKHLDHVRGYFELPAPSKFHRNLPGIGLPSNKKCRSVEMTAVPRFDQLEIWHRPLHRDPYAVQESFCSTPSYALKWLHSG